jgi:secondary thiamine-phosphate synthase enzyme
MSWFQKTINLPSKSRGSYLITDDIVRELPELKTYKVGLLNLFIQHTSCALSLNENWDEDVRADMSDALDRIVPQDRKGNLYRHSAEGLDDMPVSVLNVPGRCLDLTGSLSYISTGALLILRCRRMLKALWWERVLRFRFGMGGWQRGRGKVFGFWNLEKADINGR